MKSDRIVIRSGRPDLLAPENITDRKDDRRYRIVANHFKPFITTSKITIDNIRFKYDYIDNTTPEEFKEQYSSIPELKILLLLQDRFRDEEGNFIGTNQPPYSYKDIQILLEGIIWEEIGNYIVIDNLNITLRHFNIFKGVSAYPDKLKLRRGVIYV